MNVVPVWLGYQFAGLVEATGILLDEGDHLLLENQRNERLIGDTVSSAVREIRIPREILSTVSLRESWLGLKTELVIQSTRMAPVADVPWMSQGRIVLWVARRDRAAAEKLVADLGLPGPSSIEPATVDTGLV